MVEMEKKKKKKQKQDGQEDTLGQRKREKQRKEEEEEEVSESSKTSDGDERRRKKERKQSVPESESVTSSSSSSSSGESSSNSNSEDSVSVSNFFDEEAEDGPEAGGESLSGSEPPDDQMDENPTTNSPIRRSTAIEPKCYEKPELKICRRFAGALLVRAESSGWEDHELASLLFCVVDELGLEGDEVVKLARKYKVGKPMVLSALMDEGVNLEPGQILSCLRGSLHPRASFAQVIEEALEQGLFDLHNTEVLDALYTEVVKVMELEEDELLRFTRKLCSFAETKGSCGVLLNIFVQHMEAREGGDFISRVIDRDFFADLRGDIEELLVELHEEVKSVVEVYHATHIAKVESDVDENGNLDGFVVDDEVVSYDSSAVMSDEGEREHEPERVWPPPKKKRRSVLDDADY
jgi:hypothetical protein